jgi:2-iminobutanoate/2-iminopropanoate deaminase
MFQTIQTTQAPAAIGPYSQALRVGNWLFVSGQIGLLPDSGELIGGTLVDQARQALRNLQNILTAAGCTRDHVVSVDVFLTDMSQFGAFNTVYEEFFGGHKPVRAVVEVKGLPRGAMVEIKCLACLEAV